MDPFRPFSSVNREQWKQLLFSVLYVILGIGIGLLIGELLFKQVFHDFTKSNSNFTVLHTYLGVFLPGIIEIFSWNRPPPRDPTFMEMVRSKFDGLPFYDQMHFQKKGINCSVQNSHLHHNWLFSQIFLTGNTVIGILNVNKQKVKRKQKKLTYLSASKLNANSLIPSIV